MSGVIQIQDLDWLLESPEPNQPAERQLSAATRKLRMLRKPRLRQPL
jgi:hypothetical protein